MSIFHSTMISVFRANLSLPLQMRAWARRRCLRAATRSARARRGARPCCPTPGCPQLQQCPPLQSTPLQRAAASARPAGASPSPRPATPSSSWRTSRQSTTTPWSSRLRPVLARLLLVLGTTWSSVSRRRMELPKMSRILHKRLRVSKTV